MSFFPSPGDSMRFLEPGFKIILNWLKNDYARTVIMIILLATVIIRVLQASLSKSPLKENANKIAVPLGLIATLGGVYKFKDSLEQFSWIIFIAFLIALLAPLFSKLGFGGFFSRRGRYGDYNKREKTVKKDIKRVKHEKRQEHKAEKDVHKEVKSQNKEEKLLHSLSPEEEDLVRKFRQLTMEGKL